MRVITFGTFDILHMGHIKILERAKLLGTTLIVGVSTDEMNYIKKGRYPVYCQEHRLKMIQLIKYVDESFYEESLELKRNYILQNKADILVMGNDWENKFNEYRDICEVIYLERTPSISTTEIIELIKSRV